MSVVTETISKTASAPHFDAAKLDGLLEAVGVDAIVATSRHNFLYLAGGYPLFFYENPGVGEDRMLPALGYVRSKPDEAFLVASPQEVYEYEIDPPWVATIDLPGFTTLDTARAVARRLAERGLDRATIGIEEPFAPVRFTSELVREFPNMKFVDITPQMSLLRAIKRPDEIETIRVATEKVSDAMYATMTGVTAGTTTIDIYNRFVAEQVARGIKLEGCALNTGIIPLRAPSTKVRWEKGAVLSLDSGGSYKSYGADITRMGVMGEPTHRMRDLLDQATAIQDAARAALIVGATGRDVLEATFAAATDLPDAKGLDSNYFAAETVSFNIHGVGMVRHEPPRLDVGGPVTDHGDLDTKLEAGMVLSVDTNLPSPDVGMVKLEDMVVITDEGCVGFGDEHRGWTIVDV